MRDVLPPEPRRLRRICNRGVIRQRLMRQDACSTIAAVEIRDARDAPNTWADSSRRTFECNQRKFIEFGVCGFSALRTYLQLPTSNITPSLIYIDRHTSRSPSIHYRLRPASMRTTQSQCIPQRLCSRISDGTCSYTQ